MDTQTFNHPNELLALAPLNADGDHLLFVEQNFRVLGVDLVQWDFVLHNGKDWHFRQKFMHLREAARLGACKDAIRQALKNESEH